MKKFITISRMTLIISCLLISAISCTYTSRYVFLNVPDVYDYKKLPSRNIKTAEKTNFDFKTANGFKLDPFTFNNTTVDNLDSFLEQSGTNAFIIVRNDTILYERYFNGHDHDTYCKAFSASKVFISALIGKAIEEGFIQSVNDPVMKYIPEIKDKRFAGLTIADCLSMTSGINTNNKEILPWHDKVRIYYTHDLRKLMSGIEYDHEPGKEFYSEEVSPVLLGLIVERATGKSVSKYLEEKIWKPLGMEQDALWVTDRKTDGFEAVNSGLTGTAIDFAKFGRLYLNEGNWNGENVISPEWIRKTTRPDTTSISFYKGIEYYGGRNVYYNSEWWGLAKNNEDYEYSASGHFGQRIYISKEKNAVLIRFGSKEGKVDWTSLMMKVAEKI
jgi:CubicO group peptidase (beta-lactamase class C family)